MAASTSALENNARDVVENCVNSDDISQLLRQVFEVQSMTLSLQVIEEEGAKAVELLQTNLLSVAQEQERTVNDVCHANALEIAAGVGELDLMYDGVHKIAEVMVGGNASLQKTGRVLLSHARELHSLLEVQQNISAARSAMAAAKAVLDKCLAVGRHMEEGQLYKALCLLRIVRANDLGELMGQLAGGQLAGLLPSQRAAALASRSTITPAQALSQRRLQAFFYSLVNDLYAALESLAMAQFNDWLVAVRDSAREVGMRAIRKAAIRRAADEDFARERKAVLAQLSSKRRPREIAAEVASSKFRLELLKDSAPPVAPVQAGGPRRGGGGVVVPLSPESSAPRAELAELFPGQPDAAIDSLRRDQLADSHSRLGTAEFEVDVSDTNVGLLFNVGMQGLHRCVHIHACLGRLDQFREHYAEQRRLQVNADLQPPANFLENYQPYLAQLAGFFIVEDGVSRSAEGLLTSAQVIALWDSTLSRLKGVLERALDAMSAPSVMLLVKDFVLLAATALHTCGFAVTTLEEVLLTARGKYHDLLMAAAVPSVSAVVESDVLAPVSVRTPAQHAEMAGLGLPGFLEGQAESPLPYFAPYSSCVPALLSLVHGFVMDSIAYLRGLYSPWDITPALFFHRDRFITKVVVDALAGKVSVVNSAEMMAECMRLAADAAVLILALEPLDRWTAAQVRLSSSEGTSSDADADAALLRARNRTRAAGAEGAATALPSNATASLRAVQDSAERNLLRLVCARVSFIMDDARNTNWQPAAPLPAATSAYVDTLIVYLQETLALALSSLPRTSYTHLSRTALRGVSAAIMRLFGAEGVRGFNRHAIERLAADLQALQQFAGGCGVSDLREQLAEPQQLCQLLMSDALEDVLVPELRQLKYPALELATVALALDKYREVPALKTGAAAAGGAAPAGPRPAHPAKKYVDALAKQLRTQMITGSGPRVLEDL